MPNAAKHKQTHQYGALSSLSTSQRERLAHIDFTLMFKGEAGRGDLIDRFSIAPTQATKDFALYHELASANIVYDKSKRLHLRACPLSRCSIMTLLGPWPPCVKVMAMASWVRCPPRCAVRCPFSSISQI
ncbi:hypothetical protein [Halomonas sp. BC04]|uniref:hypothetical protein n=1 Tax=Halomonas sp. BC04 TaxID=1403540 RepID=UPI0004BCE0DC